MGHVTSFTFTQYTDQYPSSNRCQAFVTSLPPFLSFILLLFCCLMFDGLHDGQPELRTQQKKKKNLQKKTKSNARKRSGDNENAILWTPLLTPFAQTDILGPKGLGFLLYEGRGLKGA